MEYYILDIALFVLFMIGFILVMMSVEILGKHDKRVLKLYKSWFFISQGIALLIVLFMMSTERNQIPIIGYSFLLAVNFYAGMTTIAGVIVPPKERSPSGKKLLKLSKWTFCIGMVLTIGWAMFWWKEIFG